MRILAVVIVWMERVRDQMQERVAQQTASRKRQQHLQQRLILACLATNRNKEQDHKRSNTNQQSRPGGVQRNVHALFELLGRGGSDHSLRLGCLRVRVMRMMMRLGVVFMAVVVALVAVLSRLGSRFLVRLSGVLERGRLVVFVAVSMVMTVVMAVVVTAVRVSVMVTAMCVAMLARVYARYGQQKHEYEKVSYRFVHYNIKIDLKIFKK